MHTDVVHGAVAQHSDDNDAIIRRGRGSREPAAVARPAKSTRPRFLNFEFRIRGGVSLTLCDTQVASTNMLQAAYPGAHNEILHFCHLFAKFKAFLLIFLPLRLLML